ncbi:hypothetical protein RFI_17548 [Reticulomyxa filosa]|uniref:Uncharacterized protein n=1 Tax=Reticulomyxa filosa TaxID=46433 RepID=X6N196_RETFI|nr:hypothetical protein RFI_17548 [Reticulomyxa filosa]|eukprot:ETO19683.1 hypothetical protein RFI_17548 [Reticulomyxa filosa]
MRTEIYIIINTFICNVVIIFKVAISSQQKGISIDIFTNMSFHYQRNYASKAIPKHHLEDTKPKQNSVAAKLQSINQRTKQQASKTRKKQPVFTIKTITTESPVLQCQIGQIQKDLLLIFQEESRVQCCMDNLKHNKDKAMQTVEDLFDESIALLKEKKEVALHNIRRYTEGKNNEFIDYSQDLKKRAKQLHKQIADIVELDKYNTNGLTSNYILFQIDETMYHLDPAISIQLHNTNDNISEMLAQLFSQQLVIIERGSVQVVDITIGRTSSGNPHALVHWRTNNIIKGDHCSLELQLSSYSENNNSAKWYISTLCPKESTIGTIPINGDDEK